MSRHAGVHAAGVLIAPKPLVEYLPLYRNSNDEITTQFEMKSVDRMGLLKMDFLGLITLTILDDALRFVMKKTGKRPDLSAIPLDDPEVYRLFADGRTDGVFQFESSGMRDLLRRVKPEVFDDLAALNALYRPGALDAGTVEVYIQRRRGTKFEYPLPQLEPILKDTYGVLVYQEQVMLAARAVAGYSPGEADKLRKAIGKKDEALLKAEGDKFVKKAVANGTPKKKAEELWALILPFGRYGFNKSHSVVYALLAYRTAWMKVHHPVEFLAATLTANSGSSDEVVKYVNTCRDMKIPVLPPDVNASDLSFAPDGPAIRFGLGAVKGVGEGAVASILAARAGDGPFKSLTDFCSRVDLRLNNRRVVEALIKSGCFDSLGKSRAAFLDGLDHAIDVATDAREAASSNQALLFDVPKETRIEDQFPGQGGMERRREDPLREGDARFLHHGPSARAIRGRDPDVRRRDVRDAARAPRRTGEARGPRRGGQEEPDQERPERGKDDGEGHRRGPHGLRARDRFRGPSRARRIVARAGAAGARHRNGAPRNGAGRRDA